MDLLPSSPIDTTHSRLTIDPGI